MSYMSPQNGQSVLKTKETKGTQVHLFYVFALLSHPQLKEEENTKWKARHYKARLEAMATLNMNGCVPPLAMQDKV